MKESEVQAVLVAWFKLNGYDVTETYPLERGAKIDLVARSDKDEWRVEVKGDYDRNSAQYLVNFDTGIGQLLKSVTSLDARISYGIGLPISRTERRERLSYRLVLPKYARSLAFEALNIHLLLVRDDGSVQVIPPNQVRSYLGSIRG